MARGLEGMGESVDVDVVVAGGGVGGLMAAHTAQRAGARVLLLGGSGGASNRISSLNTALGYAPQDTAAGIFDDMFRAGGYVNDPALVAALADRIGPETLALAEMGVEFLRDGDRLARRQAAGSTWTRAVFSLGMIGVDIARTLVAEIASFDENPVVHIKGGWLLDLFTEDGRVVGGLVYGSRDERWLQVYAGAVVLATGGGGQLFGTTTNPRGSKGIGYALALDAGAELSDMEFVSFEPFVTHSPDDPRRHGEDLPTTVLREGARLRNGLGEEFLDSASPTKDIICRAMVREVLEGRGTPAGAVYYDLRDMDPAAVDRYVQIGESLRSRGITSREAQLEVMPAQHYLMGGVRIGADAASSVPGLYAVGEVAGGAHGGHRLAAGGGMEVVAGGAIAGDSAAAHGLAAHGLAQRAHDRGPEAAPRPELIGARLSPESQAHLGRIRSALDHACGILRNGPDLESAVQTIGVVLDEVRHDPEQAFIRRSAQVALAIARSALARSECRGDHYRTDHPRRDDRSWIGNLVTRLDDDGDLELRFDAAPVRDRRPGGIPIPQPA